MAAKLALAAAHKAVIAHRPRGPVLEETFQVEANAVNAD
jgi:hypothetical protein